MTIDAYRAEIKLKLFGNILKSELDDPTLDAVINSALREVQRYIDSTKLLTIPFSRCIDLSKYPIDINAITRIFRTQSYMTGSDSDTTSNVPTDPMYLGAWQMLSGAGGMYNISDWTYNLASWNTAMQVRNTISTDLFFRYDRDANLLYVNVSTDYPDNITIEYVPRFNSVEEVKQDFWIDIILNLAIAQTKVILGRIRTRHSQTNALWTQDGETLLAEGNAELQDIRQKMQDSSQLCYPID